MLWQGRTLTETPVSHSTALVADDDLLAALSPRPWGVSLWGVQVPHGLHRGQLQLFHRDRRLRLQRWADVQRPRQLHLWEVPVHRAWGVRGDL